jgi:DNA invertase Pin-like site-specific DNA recombinase
MRPREALREFRKLSRKLIAAVQKDQERFHREMATLVLGQVMQDDKARAAKLSAAIRKGLERAKRQGKRIGGARRRPAFDRERIRRLARKGCTQTAIAKSLGCTQGLVSKVLKAERQKAGRPKQKECSQ